MQRFLSLPGVEFLRRFLQHVLPRAFHKVRYFGLWHPSKRDLSSRAWLLFVLEKPTGAVRPVKIADPVERSRLRSGHGVWVAVG